MESGFKSVLLTCALATVFGFIGSGGATLVLRDQIKGDRGAPGARGPQGAAGPAGPEGSPGPAGEVPSRVQNALVDMQERIAKLEAAGRPIATAASVPLPSGSYLFMPSVSGRSNYGCPSGTRFVGFAEIPKANGFAEPSNLCEVR
jgi:hypothetical protein